MTALADQQINRLAFRSALFSRRGLDSLSAEKLAEKLTARDLERDDRHACVECESIQRNEKCFKQLPVSKVQLIRCHGFTFQKP